MVPARLHEVKRRLLGMYEKRHYHISREAAHNRGPSGDGQAFTFLPGPGAFFQKLPCAFLDFIVLFTMFLTIGLLLAADLPEVRFYGLRRQKHAE